MDIQLALDVEIEGLEGNHVLDVGHFALEGSLVGRQETVALHAHAHGLAVLHLLGLHGDHAADGGFHETYGLIKLFALFLGQLLFEHTFQDLVGIHQVFADDDVEGRAVCSPALAQACHDIGHDELQDSGAHSRCHDVAVCDGIGGGLGIVAVDSGHVGDHHILMAGTCHIADGIALFFLQGLDNRLCHIDKGVTVAGLAQSRTDKAAADIAAAIHNSIHNYFSFILPYTDRTAS